MFIAVTIIAAIIYINYQRQQSHQISLLDEKEQDRLRENQNDSYGLLWIWIIGIPFLWSINLPI